MCFVCGERNCNMGLTSDGKIVSRFPRCIGGFLHVSKPDFEGVVRPLDTFSDDDSSASVVMEPLRTVKASVKNYRIVKEEGEWKFDSVSGLLRAKPAQETLITLTRQDNSFTGYASVKGASSSDLQVVPGRYKINIMSLYRGDVKILPDERCFSVKKLVKSDRKCFLVPEKAVVFNSTSPFPYGMLEYDYVFTSDMLRGAKAIEFRQFVVAIDEVDEKKRVIEDLNEVVRTQEYADSYSALVYPVVVR